MRKIKMVGATIKINYHKNGISYAYNTPIELFLQYYMKINTNQLIYQGIEKIDNLALCCQCEILFHKPPLKDFSFFDYEEIFVEIDGYGNTIRVQAGLCRICECRNGLEKIIQK